SEPVAVLSLPVVLEKRAWEPSAVLLLPVVLELRAREPVAVLFVCAWEALGTSDRTVMRVTMKRQTGSDLLKPVFMRTSLMTETACGANKAVSLHDDGAIYSESLLGYAPGAHG